MGGGGQDSILGSAGCGRKAKDFDREGREEKAAKVAKKIKLGQRPDFRA
jgi:hypothetical protein